MKSVWKRVVLCALALCSVSRIGAGEEIGGPFSWSVGKYCEKKGTTVIVSVPKDEAHGQHFVSTPFDLRKAYGKSLVFLIRARAKNVSVPPEKWNGVKFMLSFRTADGLPIYKHPVQLWGSFQRELFFSVDVPKGASNGKLSLGLQNSSGEVEFDLSSLRIRKGEQIFRKVNENHIAEYSDAVRNRPVHRGVMLGRMTEKDYRDLAAYGANLGRAQLVRAWGQVNTDLDLEEYDRWLNSRLDRLEQEFQWAEQNGIRLIIDLHSPPGGRDELKELRLQSEKKYLDHFLEVWRRIARRFQGKKALWGYNLVNEPNQNRAVKYDYWTVQKMAAEEIRKIDPETPIYVESNLWSAPATFSYFSPIKLKNIIYQFHMYQPGQFTHQLVGGNFGEKGADELIRYPGVIGGKYWNKEELRKTLAPVREFQQKHRAKIFCGEFSAIIWAPGADQYLRDCISLFEEYGWDWTYHAFREWNGWSVEHEFDWKTKKMVPSSGNSRKQALLEGLSRNRKQSR